MDAIGVLPLCCCCECAAAPLYGYCRKRLSRSFLSFLLETILLFLAFDPDFQTLMVYTISSNQTSNLRPYRCAFARALVVVSVVVVLLLSLCRAQYIFGVVRCSRGPWSLVVVVEVVEVVGKGAWRCRYGCRYSC